MSTESGDVESLVQRLDGGDDAVQLLCFRHRRARAGLDAADVEDVGAFGDELFGPAKEGVEVEVAARVEERVGRAVEDAHDK